MNNAYPTVCIHISRYVEGFKCHKIVDLPAQVLVPEFDDTSAVLWLRYDVRSAVIHLGRFTTSGHCRARLMEERWRVAHSQ